MSNAIIGENPSLNEIRTNDNDYNTCLQGAEKICIHLKTQLDIIKKWNSNENTRKEDIILANIETAPYDYMNINSSTDKMRRIENYLLQIEKNELKELFYWQFSQYTEIY